MMYDVSSIYDNILWVMKCASTTNIMIGKYEEALVYYKEALDARRSKLGNTHPDTLVSISNMGNVLQAQGKINNDA